MKVHYLVGCPFEERDYERLGVQALIQKGHEVHVWDVSHVLNPLRHREAADSGQIYALHNYFVVKSRKEFRKIVSRFETSSVVMNIIGLDISTAWVYRALLNCKSRHGGIFLGTLPPSSNDEKNKKIKNAYDFISKIKKACSGPLITSKKIYKIIWSKS